MENDPVPDSLRYRVLKKAGGKCELCGALKQDTTLHIDHIVPRSRGGSNDESNLQILCFKCNLGKSNKDETDFRV
ncbi:MAG: HNH endonuclease [Verrucomicrobia bacterium]|nr:HNH endonuclease [Verrucomicrobiota bacterium]